MRSFSILFLVCFWGVASGFAPTTPFLSKVGTQQKSSNALALFAKQTNNNNNNNNVVQEKEHTSAAASSLVSLMGTSGLLWSLSGTVASAAGPDWGLFEGRTGSLLHPVMMGGLVLLSAYTALLGFQWRRQRTLGDEISQLKKQLPSLGEGQDSVASALEAAQQAEEVDPVLVATLKQALVTQAEIQTLTDERKELVQLGPRDKHYNNGAILAFLGTAFAIEVSSPVCRRCCCRKKKKAHFSLLLLLLSSFLLLLHIYTHT